MFTTVMAVYCGLITLGLIGIGLIAFHHLLKRKDGQMTMDQIKEKVIPELEQMTYRMLDKTMDELPDKCIEMTKRMIKAQKEFEDDL